MVKSESNTYFEVSEYNNKEELPIDAWKVRPCEWYKDEFKDCKSVRARMHQYFVYGESTDCSQWKKDLDNCLHFRKKGDMKSLESVIESENERCERRKNTVIKNNVWEYRNEAPENWNSPMPDWMLKKKEKSLLFETQTLLSQGIAPSPIFTGISCTIM